MPTIKAGGLLRLPAEAAELWNTILVEGGALPGKALFPQFTVKRKVDTKESPGSDVWSVTDKGAECSDVTLELELWTAEHFAAWSSLYPKYFDPRRPLKRRSVIAIAHPALHFHGIRQLYGCEAEGLQPRGGPLGTVYVAKIKGKEFNEKTRIGGGGSAKPKPAPSYAGQGGKWTTGALGSAPVYGPPADAATPTATTKPGKTLAQQQTAARQGDPRAAFVAKVAATKAPQ